MVNIFDVVNHDVVVNLPVLLVNFTIVGKTHGFVTYEPSRFDF